ncbi:PepSY-associated TM helix domain-containing protein [Dyella sp.]|uniref:PepSY-associated TM helix domain-containing protein n=1 Tax=Dyella sp. TaxID=1869338 RepID=UPI003217C9D6
MKSSTIRTFQTVHTWAGLLAGFALFVAFYAGALTVFHHDIALWQSPPWRSEPARDVSVQTMIDRLLAAHPKAAKDFGIVLAPPGTAQGPYAYWNDGEEHFATADKLDRPTDDAGATRGQLADFVYALHDSLGIPVVGLYLMGIVSVIYGLALISGLLIHLPQLLGDLFALRPGRNLKRLWQDAHNAIGVLSLPFHIIFAVTGALMCLFVPLFAALNLIAFDGKLDDAFAKAISTAPTVQASGRAAPMLSAEALIERARASALSLGVTRFEPDYVHYDHYGDANALVQVRGVSERTLGTYGTIALNGATGAVLEQHVGAAHSVNGLVNSSIYALHFGNFGGRAVQWLYFLLGLAGAFLFYSGNLLWIESRRKRRHAEQPRKTLVMARATLGVCLGTCAGIAAAFAATMLAQALGIDPAMPQQAACYGVVALAVAYACMRPVARAAVELLLFTAAAHVAVAIADLIRNAPAWSQPWTPQSLAVLGVDLTGIALAIGFAWLARASRQRALHGDAHSVWAASSARAGVHAEV